VSTSLFGALPSPDNAVRRERIVPMRNSNPPRGQDLTGHRQELVKGSAGGVTEVKATHRVLPDGRLLVKSRYLKNGQWEDGRETHHVEDPAAVVRFEE
jgi:hypothetical protein